MAQTRLRPEQLPKRLDFNVGNAQSHLLPGDTVWTKFNDGPYILIEHKADTLVVDAHVARPKRGESTTARHVVSRTTLVRDKRGEHHIFPRDILTKKKIPSNRLTGLDYVILCAAAGSAASVTQVVLNLLGY